MANCCTFTNRFCTQSGQVVVGRMKLQNGVFSIVYYDLNGSLYTGNDIVFPSCQPAPSNILTVRFRFIDVNCDSDFGGCDKMRCELIFSDINALQNGTKIVLNMSSANSAVLLLESVLNPLGVFTISGGEIEIVDISLITSPSIIFILGYEDIACAEANTYNGVVDNVIFMNSGWSNGTHTGDSIIKI